MFCGNFYASVCCTRQYLYYQIISNMCPKNPCNFQHFMVKFFIVCNGIETQHNCEMNAVILTISFLIHSLFSAGC